MAGSAASSQKARQRGDDRLAAAYFNATHPLAAAAHALCEQHEQQEYPAAGRIGNLACWPCWELAIRQNQDELAGQRGGSRLATVAS